MANRTHLFSNVHTISANNVASVQPEHAATARTDTVAFVSLMSIISAKHEGVQQGALGTRLGTWNYFFGGPALDVIDYGKKANPDYDAVTNPDVPQNVPLQFDTASAAEAAYDALVA